MKQDWRAKFYTDPDWQRIVDEFNVFISDCQDISTIDTNRPSEAVHADIIARRIIAEKLRAFIDSTLIFAKNANKPRRSFK